eukprot:m.44266 g.44266  ORF g.44266 m.44266 type:complete len:616 (+) comp11690_c0_seq1:471-2318(+)
MAAAFVFIFAVIALASLSIGQFGRDKLGLPLLTGFLLSGILCGPHVLKLLDKHDVEDLEFVTDISLGYIAFAAGAELFLPDLKPCMRAIWRVSVAQMLGTLVVGTVLIYAFATRSGFMDGLAFSETIVLSFLGGIIFAAKSPSSAIAIINELGAKGPFSQTVLGVIMLSDVLVIALFAIGMDLARSVFDPLSSISGEFITVIVGELTLSYVVGRIATFALLFILRLTGNNLKSVVRKRTPYLYREVWLPYFRGRGDLFRGALLLFIGWLIFFLQKKLDSAVHIKLEDLLMCMVASFYTINRDNAADGFDYREAMHHVLARVALPVYVCFFAVVGLDMDISVIPDVIGVAVYYFFARLVVTFVGSFLGGWWAGAPVLHNKVSWMAYITQAGVALAFTKQIKDEWNTPPNDFGNDYATTMVAMIVVGQLLGPVVTKVAIKAVKEHGKMGGAQSGGENHKDGLALTVWWLADDDGGSNNDSSSGTFSGSSVSSYSSSGSGSGRSRSNSASSCSSTDYSDDEGGTSKAADKAAAAAAKSKGKIRQRSRTQSLVPDNNNGSADFDSDDGDDDTQSKDELDMTTDKATDKATDKTTPTLDGAVQDGRYHLQVPSTDAISEV